MNRPCPPDHATAPRTVSVDVFDTTIRSFAERFCRAVRTIGLENTTTAVSFRIDEGERASGPFYIVRATGRGWSGDDVRDRAALADRIMQALAYRIAIPDGQLCRELQR